MTTKRKLYGENVMIWEYLADYLPIEQSIKGRSDLLSKHGKDRWELVAATVEGTNAVFYFKRLL